MVSHSKAHRHKQFDAAECGPGSSCELLSQVGKLLSCRADAVGDAQGYDLSQLGDLASLERWCEGFCQWMYYLTR